MPQTPYAYAVSSDRNQVYIGTATDIEQTFPLTAIHYFISEEALLASLDGFRSDEMIITTLSDLPTVQHQWDNKNQYNLSKAQHSMKPGPPTNNDQA